jgi:hydroxyacylglutathione hydrolase
VDDPASELLQQSRGDLAMIGLDRLAGYFSWPEVRAREPRLETIPQTSAEQLATQLEHDDIHVLDVRSAAEWREGHIAGAQNIPLGELHDRLDEVPREGTIVVHCLGGTRSAIAASILQANDRREVMNFAGGYGAWRAAGLASESPAARV